MKIGIAGSGGIGSNVAVHLVRAGVKELKFGDLMLLKNLISIDNSILKTR